MTNRTIHLILHHPEGSLNIGAVARAMANFDVSSLHLVRPAPEWLNAHALQMACNAQEILRNARSHNSIEDALAGCSYVAGFTARTSHDRLHHCSLPELPEVLRKTPHLEHEESSIGLLFGCERTGLPNEALEVCHQLVSIPTGVSQPSLNLAQAVIVALYELREFSTEQRTSPPHSKELPPQGAAYTHLRALTEAVATGSGFVRTGGVSVKALRHLQRALQRGAATEAEIKALLGFLNTIARKLEVK